jgi:hypothetical protein
MILITFAWGKHPIKYIFGARLTPESHPKDLAYHITSGLSLLQNPGLFYTYDSSTQRA